MKITPNRVDLHRKRRCNWFVFWENTSIYTRILSDLQKIEFTLFRMNSDLLFSLCIKQEIILLTWNDIFPPNAINIKCSETLTATLFTQRHVPLRFRSTTFRKCGRTTTAKVTFFNKSPPDQCKCNTVLLFFCAVFRPIRSYVNVVS